MTSLEIDLSEIESKIYLVRGERVMLDEDLARLYQVPTRRLNEQVQRNTNRFPPDFFFFLSNQELENLKSQFATSSSLWGGRRKPTRAFTEQGVAMLSSVLNSPRAVDVNIAIMRTFVRLRRILNSNQELEKKILDLESRYDGKFQIVFAAIKKLVAEQATPRKKIEGLSDY
jgi:hypothetical protein